MADRDEFGQLWCSQAAGPQVKGEDMLAMAMRKARQFDRTIKIRNAVECAAAAVVAVFFGLEALWSPNGLLRAGNLVVAASGLWIIFCMLRYGREARDPAPDQSLAGFRQALLRKYEHQIRLLKSVKYWYLLPPYAGLMLVSAGILRESAAKGRAAWSALIVAAVCTAVFAGVWWLNEVHGVRWLNRQRAQLLEGKNFGEGDR